MNEKVKTVLKLRSWVNIAHHIPGRIRLKYKLGIIAHLARFNAKDIEKTLNDIPAFKHYKLNGSTGSVLIEYDPVVVNPSLLDELFSTDDNVAEQACYKLADCLSLDGAR